MADISKEIKDFRDAQYGEEVRGSLISLAEKLNKESTDAKDAAEQAAKDAHESIDVANSAASEANGAAGRAAASAEAANEAASGANNAANLASGSASAADAAAADANAAAKEASDVAGEVQRKLDNGEFVGPPGSIENLMGQSITFEQAAARANVQSGDSLAVAFGKLAKYCADLEAAKVGLTGKYSDMSGIGDLTAQTTVADTDNMLVGTDVAKKITFANVFNAIKNKLTGAISSILTTNLANSMALVSDASGKVAAHGTVTATELGYMHGATSNIQNQIGTLSALGTTAKGNLVSAINELNTGKISNIVKGQLVIQKNDLNLTPTIYEQAPLFINSDMAPGIGLHRPGYEAAFLFYQNGTLKLITHEGVTYNINMTKTGNL